MFGSRSMGLSNSLKLPKAKLRLCIHRNKCAAARKLAKLSGTDFVNAL